MAKNKGSKAKAKKLKRLTLEMVKDAYKKTGLSPRREVYAAYDDMDETIEDKDGQCVERCNVWTGKKLRGEACAIGVVGIALTGTKYLHDKGLSMSEEPEKLADYLGLPKAYHEGFISGFDGNSIPTPPKTKSAEAKLSVRKQGELDGWRIGTAIFGEDD